MEVERAVVDLYRAFAMKHRVGEAVRRDRRVGRRLGRIRHARFAVRRRARSASKKLGSERYKSIDDEGAPCRWPSARATSFRSGDRMMARDHRRVDHAPQRLQRDAWARVAAPAKSGFGKGRRGPASFRRRRSASSFSKGEERQERRAGAKGARAVTSAARRRRAARSRLARSFTYELPARLADRAVAGARVVCPRSDRDGCSGSCSAQREGSRRRRSPMRSPTPPTKGSQRSRWSCSRSSWKSLASYYFAPIGEVVRLTLPPVEEDDVSELAEPSLFEEEAGGRRATRAVGKALTDTTGPRDGAPRTSGRCAVRRTCAAGG